MSSNILWEKTGHSGNNVSYSSSDVIDGISGEVLQVRNDDLKFFRRNDLDKLSKTVNGGSSNVIFGVSQ